MKALENALKNQVENFVLVGESGSGKSEIALNLAVALSLSTGQLVDFYDLDMTKPLFRSRDLEAAMQPEGVKIHFQEQFMDSPAVARGVGARLKAKGAITVVDVGGNHTGARMIGAYARELNKANTSIYYVINIYRPWSKNLAEIDRTLSEILAVTHIKAEKIKFIANPNFGRETTLDEFLDGKAFTRNILPENIKVEFYCTQKELYKQLREKQREGVFPLELYLSPR